MATRKQSDEVEETGQEQVGAQDIAEPSAEGQENLADEKTEGELNSLAEEKMEKAAKIVWRKMLYAGGVGLIPVPILDLAAFLGFQIYMTKQLADVFEVPYSEHWAKSIISSLLGSVVPVGAAVPLAYGLKHVPVVGRTTSALSMSIMGAACTYALGKIFTSRFASGKSYMTFKTETLKEAFKEHFKEGREVVAGMVAAAQA